MRLAVNASEWAPTRGEWERALGLIERCEPNEAARIARYKLEQDRKRTLLGRILLRHACSQVLNMAFGDVRFTRTAANKPVCLDLAHGEVNISHHGSWVVLALEANCRQVGVDVMRYDQPRDLAAFFQSMRHQFTPAEWTAIGTSAETFYRHWALKESLVKAIGVGLGFNLQRASFAIHQPGSRVELEIDGQPAVEWKFHLTDLDELHCVAVALMGGAADNDQPFQPVAADALIESLRLI